MSEFTQFVDLASERLGGRVVLANDEFFGPKEYLLKREKPVFIAGKYNDRGKWMDGWETRRRRTPGCDWCIVRLGLPGIFRRGFLWKGAIWVSPRLTGTKRKNWELRRRIGKRFCRRQL